MTKDLERRLRRLEREASAREKAPIEDGDQLISDHGVSAILGISRTGVWRRVEDGTIPKPIRIGGLTRWSRREIMALIERALAERDNSGDGQA